MNVKTLKNLKRRVRDLCRDYDRMCQLEAARAIETGDQSDLIDESQFLQNKGYKGLAFLCEAGLKGWVKANKRAILNRYKNAVTPSDKASKLLNA